MPDDGREAVGVYLTVAEPRVPNEAGSLVVRLTTWQVLTLVIAAAGVLLGVYVTTDRLNTSVGMLRDEIVKLTNIIDRVAMRVNEVERFMYRSEEKHEVMEKRLDRVEGKK